MLKLQADMKLLFDARYIRTDFHDGISRYSAELGSALARLTAVTFVICDQDQLKLLPAGSDYILIHAPTSAMEPLTSLVLNRYHPDVVFSPMQTMGSVGRRFKLILTIHDMIYYRHRTPPRQLNLAIGLGWRLYHATYLPQRVTLNSADVVATVSQTSKADIEKASLTKREIVVIPNAAQNLSQYLDEPVSLAKAPKNLVYIGSFMLYKNVETLIASLEFLPGYRLHLLSRITAKRKDQLLALAPADASIIFHAGVSDADYAQLLADRAIMVSASCDEGYGLPLAEALKLGVPAVVSDLTIFHEVAGDGALYFPANDPVALADKIIQLDDLKLRQRIAKNGKAHILQFNWAKSAQTLLDSAQKLIS